METFNSNVTGKYMFDVILEKLLKENSRKFAGVCTDGANVMTGRKKGFIGQLKENGFEVHSFHCIIHQVALASKFLSNHATMKIAEQIINKLRGGHHSLTHRKLVSFLKSSGAKYNDLKMFTEVRWLSRGESINILFNIRAEVVQFLKIEKLENSETLIESLENKDFILDLAFLSDITNYLNNLNLELQGKRKTIQNLVKKMYFISKQF